MEEEISHEKRILNEAFITWYNSRYYELIASELLAKWEMVDRFIQIGIILTATGGTVAGWQLWNQPGMKIVWSVLCGIVSFMAIMHKVFCVVDKIKVWLEVKQSFTMIKNQMEILRYEVKVSVKKIITILIKLDFRKFYATSKILFILINLFILLKEGKIRLKSLMIFLQLIL
ncbi:MAG: hypothetical protein AB1414_11445 [bacterium]